jgi:sec-independent protein translocase protein TatA
MVLSNLFLAIGPGQIAVIAILVLLLFGGKKIPELMKGFRHRN